MTSPASADAGQPDADLVSSQAATPNITATNPSDDTGMTNVISVYQNQPSFWGIPGEQDLAFFLGQLGWPVVVGPGGAAGKSAFASGIDYLGARTDAQGQISLLIADNKNSGAVERVSKCPAFTDTIRPNLDALRTKVADLPNFESKQQVLDKLTELINTIKNGGGNVPGVTFAISNAGGFAREPTEGLQQKFFKATGLTDPAGKPQQLDFIDLVSPRELADRVGLIDQLGGRNPRSPTYVEVTEPLVVDPARAVLSSEPLGENNMQDAWLGGLFVVQTGINFILGLFPTTAERAEAAIRPTILQGLTADPTIAGVLLIYIALVDDYSAQDLTDTLAGAHQVNASFVRYEWQYGPTPDDAYAWWAAPDKLVANHSHERPPRHYEQYFWWFDRKTTVPYTPPRTQL
jgi:hypothetical protein